MSMTISQRTSQVTALVADRLGADRVETDPAALVKLSSDWSRMSPVLQEKVPSGRYVADAIVRPRTEQEVADVLAVAYEHDVPVVPRGAGTGNYGQATPFTGGIILDLRGLDSIEVRADGNLRAGAGARMTRIDKVARQLRLICGTIEQGVCPCPSPCKISLSPTPTPRLARPIPG